ncbi:MAG TPA: class I SAM-dependent methyltransferase [Thermoanaerobaculia bacterium]|nr:class I SAM-dependent methyltransferase [Thermoanaerobaculia bacterium]
MRARDLLMDVRDRFAGEPLPPARLRARVAGTSSRRVFATTGAEAAAAIRRVFEATRDPAAEYPRWLDFGCGCGRVARHLAQMPEVRELSGVDIDGVAIAWASKQLPGHYETIESVPPTRLPERRYDVIYAGSVFTHLPEDGQFSWLRELHRLLRAGGLLIASTHPPSLSWTRPDISPADIGVLVSRGFLFLPGRGAFNDDAAFHSREYLLESWGAHFGLRCFLQSGLNNYQDLAVWQKW